LLHRDVVGLSPTGFSGVVAAEQQSVTRATA
jgi:hypothetical protein